MNTIHLITSFKFIQNQNIAYSQTIIDKFKESCLKLDASIFEPYMEEDEVFEDKEKYVFLAQLHDMFQEIKSTGLNDFNVSIKDTVCKGCSKDKPILHFKVTKSGRKKSLDEFAFMVEVEKGMLKDIYRCYDYQGCRTYIFGDNSKGFKEIEISYDLFMKSRKDYLLQKNRS